MLRTPRALYTQAILPLVGATTGAEGNGALKTCSSVNEDCAQAAAVHAAATARKHEIRIPIDYSLAHARGSETWLFRSERLYGIARGGAPSRTRTGTGSDHQQQCARTQIGDGIVGADLIEYRC